MLLASEFPALPTPPSGQLESWLIVFGCVMGLYWLGRQIYLSHFPPKQEVPEGERYVTHTFLDQRLGEMKNELSTKIAEGKAEVGKVDTAVRDLDRELSQKLRDQEKYLHESFHRLNGSQGQVQNDMSYIRGVMEARLNLEMARSCRRRKRRPEPDEGGDES